MLQVLPSSARLRRRLRLLAIVLAALVVAVLVVVLVPKYTGHVRQNFSAVPNQVVRAQAQVPLSAADRAEIGRLFDRFVPLVIERKDPGAALALVGPPLRAGTTRAQWERGEVPVYPYDAQGTSFAHAWLVTTSYRDHADLELDLHPGPTERTGAIAFDVQIRRRHGRWVVDSIYPEGFYRR